MELLCKTIIVGDPGVGKTSLINRYVNNLFRENYKSTIGVDFALKTFMRNKISVRMQLWDIAGQERFNAITRIYCKDALGVVVVFDVARYMTTESITDWKEKIDGYLEDFYGTKEPISAILVANKIDLKPGDWEKRKLDIEELMRKHHFIALFETSAKESLGIDETMNALIDDIIARKHLFVKEKAPSINLEKKKEEKEDCAC